MGHGLATARFLGGPPRDGVKVLKSYTVFGDCEFSKVGYEMKVKISFFWSSPEIWDKNRDFGHYLEAITFF